MEATPAVVASLYQADPPLAGSTADGRYIRAATLEPSLEQLGQNEPIINTAFRRYEGRKQVFDGDFPRLTIEDAREYVVALTYLIETAERG